MSDMQPRAGPDPAPPMLNDPGAGAPDPSAPIKATVQIVDLQLRLMKAELIDMQLRLAEGDPSAIRDGARLLADIRYWLKQAQDVESEIETYRKATTGRANEHAIDFDAARSQVRCRLDRLRACRGPKVIP